MDFQFRFTIGLMIKNWIEFEYAYYSLISSVCVIDVNSSRKSLTFRIKGTWRRWVRTKIVTLERKIPPL